MRVNLKPAEKLLVENAILKETIAKERLAAATEAKNNVFKSLVAEYKLTGNISLANDLEWIEGDDPKPSLDAENEGLAQAESVSESTN